MNKDILPFVLIGIGVLLFFNFSESSPPQWNLIGDDTLHYFCSERDPVEMFEFDAGQYQTKEDCLSACRSYGDRCFVDVQMN